MTVPADPPTVSAPSAPAGSGPPAPAPVPPRRRRWLVAAVVGWALLLTVLAVVSVRRDPPTVPDQLDLADARPAVDRAAGVVLGAVGADAVVEFGPLVITRDCRITPVRAGAEASRDVTVHVRPADGPSTLRVLAAALPAGYRAEVGRSGAGAREVLRADAGEFIAVRGTADDGGDVVSLRASSGCRPTSGADSSTAPTPSAPSPDVVVAPSSGLAAVLGALGRADRLAVAGAVSRQELRCPEGGIARATTVDDAGPAPTARDRALDRLTGDATVVQDGPDRYAFRLDGESIVATTVHDRLRITATTAC